MNRSIPIALSLALISSYSWAEDQAAPAAAEEQAPTQTDGPNAPQNPGAAAAEDDKAATDSAASSAAATDDAAQPAPGQEAGEQDPGKMFVMDMYSHNLYEIQLSQMAQKQAQDEPTKRLAQMLIADHTKANQQLKMVAQSMQAMVQEKLDPVHQAKLQKHQQCPKAEFSRKYANDQVAGHTMAVLELTYQSQNAENEQVKQFAAKMLPKMEQHLKQATDLAMKMAGGEARPAGSERPASDAPPTPSDASDASGQSGKDASDTSGTSGDSAKDSGQK